MITLDCTCRRSPWIPLPAISLVQDRPAIALDSAAGYRPELQLPVFALDVTTDNHSGFRCR